MKEEDCKIIRVNELKELEQAFSCGLIQVYQNIFSEPPYEEYFCDDDVAQMFNAYFSHDIGSQIFLLAYLESEVVAFCLAVPFNNKWLDFKVIDENRQTSHDCYEYFQETFGLTTKNTWYLDDLGVRKDQRRKGLAERLLQTFLTTLGSTNYPC